LLEDNEVELKKPNIMTAFEFNQQLVSLNGPMTSFATQLTSNSEDAVELVQETYLKALSNREKFRPHTNLKAWVLTIMKNLFINNYHRAAFRKTKTFSDYQFYFNEDSRPTNENPASIYTIKELGESIEKLDKKFKVPLKMFLAGYKYKEISQKLGLNIGTIKSRIFFAKRKLKRLLSN
jgi:RNA polymerase sigma-70 factor (ECF subfamily)